jgi:putative PIN family toxin of toxin-antitoxin system
MYQVVIDTNVVAAALLSNRGASHRLLRLVGDHRWRINLSVPLVFEYEQTLKRVCTGGDLSGGDIDSVVHFLCANASLRPIFFLWRPFLPDPKDDFVLELAVESRADFIITFNTRDFVGAERFGVRVISPREFLAIMGETR